MKLYYEAYGKLELIGTFETKEDCLKEISEFWKNLEYRIPYYRMIEHDDYLWIDIGFHFRFYRIYE